MIATDWDVVRLADAGIWLSGGTPLTSVDEYWGGSIPWITSGSLTTFRIGHSERRVTELGLANGTRLVQPGTLLMVVRGMSLKTEFRMGLAVRPVAFGQDCKALVPSRGFDPSFLAYALLARSDEVLNLVDEAGHGTGRLQMDLLLGIDVPRPPIEEQRGIAATLGALDDKIESNRRVVDLGLALVDSMAVAAGSVATTTAALGEVVDVAREIVDPGSFDDSVDHFSIPAFDADGWPERVPAATIKSGKQILRRPAVLLSRLNPRFNRTWWTGPLSDAPALASTEFLALTAPDDAGLARTWIAVRDSYFMAEFARRVTGTSGSHQRIRPADALGIEVPDVRMIPDAEVQRVAALLHLVHQRRAENRRLSALRDALLPELLSGRIRVPEARDAVEGATA